MKIETKFDKNDRVYFIRNALELLPYIVRGYVEAINVTSGFVTYDITDFGLHPTTYERVGEDIVFNTAQEAIRYIAKEMEHRIS